MGRKCRIQFRVTGAVCIFSALALLTLPLSWILALVTAATVHELCHLAALKLCGVPVCAISLDIGGAVIGTGMIPPEREVFCALAGPAGSLALLLLAKRMPLAALFGLIQGLFNLMPLYPMDGGRALRGMLEILFPSRWERIYKWSESCMILMLFVIGTIAAHACGAWYLLMLCLAIPVQNRIRRKIPCKDGRFRVQ